MTRMLIPLIVVALLGGAIYTAYGVYSYTPKQLGPPQFDIDTPDPETIRRTLKGEEKELDMPDQLRAEKERMVAGIQSTLKKYKDFVENVPQPASSTLKTLYQLMANGDLPVFYPELENVDGSGDLRFSELGFDAIRIGRVRAENRDDITCNASTGDSYNILVGSGRKNVLACEAPRPPRKGDVRIYSAGPGDDQIKDAGGRTIINTGSGNDMVTTGRGVAIIYVEAGWGSDTLNISCENAKLDPARFPAEMPAPWPFKYANFIVFGPSIAPADIAYKDGVVRHRNSDDKLILNENCYNYVFVNDLNEQ